jgi:HEAT repeat protein
MSVHRLLKRIDLRSAEDLQKELLGFREISLDTALFPRTSLDLIALGASQRAAGLAYPGPAVASRNRDDLGGLPFRFGMETVLFKDKAEALDGLSRKLRVAVQQCMTPPDPRPDPDKLYTALLTGEQGLFRDRKWATAEAVPCIQQMLQAQNEEVRRMSVELLRGIEGPVATEALVRWAIFDVAPANRAAAIDALKSRDLSAVTTQLVTNVRYPWPRAVEHAAEALVALNCQAAIPDLAALLSLPNPDAPKNAEIPGEARQFRREVVRVNHARNCLLCHPPSGAQGDLVRAAIPDASRPLPPPTTPSYYNNGSQFVHASTTYLRQDFSAVLPVTNPGLWPDQMRFDFFVATRPMRNGETVNSDVPNPYQAAILFALRELTGRDLGTTASSWDSAREGRATPDDRAILEISRYLALTSNPDPLLMFTLGDLGTSFFSLTDAEQLVVLARFRRLYGVANTRTGFIAYLAFLGRSGDITLQAKARTLLATFLASNGESGPIDPLVALKMLQNPNAFIRISGVSALGSLGAEGKAYYKDLLKALKDADVEVRLAAAIALGELKSGPEEMYEALALATQDGTARVRMAALNSLVQLKFLPWTVARPLAEALFRKETWATAEERLAFEKICLGLLEEMPHHNSNGYSVVLKAATGETPTQVPAASLAKLLRLMGPPPKDSLANLADLMGDPAYQTVAGDQLFSAGDDAIPVLIAALKNENAKVRAAVAELLGKAASLSRKPAPRLPNWRAASDALATLKTNDPSTDVRNAAATALTRLSSAER